MPIGDVIDDVILMMS